MKRMLSMLHVALVVLALVAGQAAWADNDLPGSDNTAEESSDILFTAEELDDLLAPIALYPDPLIAQILPAATFIDQIDEAARYVNTYGKAARIDDQPWDVSVKAVAHYPDLLNVMDQKYDWTVSLGQAYIDQQQEVMDAIQRLRAKAETVGSLTSSPQQQVIVEEEIIRIVPAEPEVMYVPQYDPLVVYTVPPDPAYGFITFGIGLTIGAWLNRDCDWQRHRVYYHGWQGGGWISQSRPHIHDRRSIYINARNRQITINRRVLQHDTERFRETIRHNLQYRQERMPTPAKQPLGSRPLERSEPRRGGVPTATPVAPPVQRSGNKDIYRGRELQGRPVPYSGYGGYGSSKDVKTIRERGQASRDNMRQLNRQPTPPQAAPVQRPAIPAGVQPAPRPVMTAPVRPSPPAIQPAPRQTQPAVQQAPRQPDTPKREEKQQQR